MQLVERGGKGGAGRGGAHGEERSGVELSGATWSNCVGRSVSHSVLCLPFSPRAPSPCEPGAGARRAPAAPDPRAAGCSPKENQAKSHKPRSKRPREEKNETGTLDEWRKRMRNEGRRIIPALALDSKISCQPTIKKSPFHYRDTCATPPGRAAEIILALQELFHHAPPLK